MIVFILGRILLTEAALMLLPLLVAVCTENLSCPFCCLLWRWRYAAP